MSDLAPFLTGLSQGIDTYLQKQQNFEQQSALQTQKAGLESKQQSQQQDEELNRQKALLDYKNKLETPEATVDRDTFETLVPGAGGVLYDHFKQQTGRDPRISEVKELAGAMKDLSPSDNAETKRQDALENKYADRVSKVVAFRSGGLGLQDQKVNQAIDLRTAINQYFDPKTDTYNFPPTVHAELVVGLDRLLSSGGQMSQEREATLRQSTAREGLAQTLIKYGLANPEQIGGPTQDVAKVLVHMIDRQGIISQSNRDTYMKGLHDLVPSGLAPDRVNHVNKANLTNSFTDLLGQSPDVLSKHLTPSTDKHPLGKVHVINPQGKGGFIPAADLDEALKNGYKQG